MRRSYNTHFEEAEMNLTPLIDVVFIVLIIFIIIAPMLEVDRVELATGPTVKEDTQPVESSPFAIHVKHDNTIWYSGKLVSGLELMQLLKRARLTQGSRIPQLFQDKRATFETYQIVKNAVEDAGYDQMDVILKPS